MDAERMSTSLLARPCSGPGEKGDHLNNNKNLTLEVAGIRDSELDDGRRSLGGAWRHLHSDGDGLGARLAPGSFSRRLLRSKKREPPRGRRGEGLL